MPNKLSYTIFLFLVLLGCKSIPLDMKNSELARNFYLKHISLDEQARVFGTYSLEDQYDIYLYGNQVIHPPATFLAYEFAKQGSAIVPFLKKKLEVAQKEVTVRDIVLVFEEMAISKQYDFSKDLELMGLLDKRANGMQGIWKGITLDYISRIRSESIPK